MNSILRKELRQSVRNRLVLGAYLLYILLLLVITGVRIANAYAKGVEGAYELGEGIFLITSMLCGAILFVFIPCQTVLRLTRERWRANPDLQYVAPLKPSMFVWGKVLSGFALAGLFAGASVPFLFIAYFLGGVDIPNLLFLLVCAAVLQFGFLLGATLLGIAPMPKFIRYLLMLGFAIGLVFATIGLCKVAKEIEPGFATTLFDRETWKIALSIFTVCASLAALLYTGVLAGFRAPGTHRVRPLRVTAAALMCLVWPAWILLAIRTEMRDDPTRHLFIIIAGIIVFATPFLMVFTSGERPAFSARQLQNIPRNLPGRFFAWLFGNGQISGMALWLLLFWPALLFITGDWCPCMKCRSQYVERFFPPDIFLLTVCAYVMSFVLGWRYFLKKRIGNSLLWFIIIASVGVLTAVLQALVAADILPKTIPGNPFAEDPDVLLLPWLYRWNALLLFAFVPLAVRDFFQFKKE